MDKVLDAVKVSTGNDGSKTFVQVEGKLGSGNAYLDRDAASGTLAAGTGLDVDLRGISTVFAGLSNAISASTEAACVTRMTAADVFDDAFSLDMDKTVHVDKASGPTMICHFAALQGLLGGIFANPVLKDCDFASDPANKVCIAGFNIVNGDVRFEGAELGLVLRTGAAWKLLGRDSKYDIHVGAAAQRTLRVDVPAGDPRALPQYTRALQFDIGGKDGSNPVGVRAAKVYQRSLDGLSWEPMPLVTLELTDACLAQLPAGDEARLGVAGSGCGASWLSLGDSGQGAGAATAGDLLIDNFYKRGRKVRIDLYADVAMTGTPVSVVKRVEGVPPKFAALASFPWLELDAMTRLDLQTYDGLAATFTATWVPNPTVSANDISFCLGGDCQGANRAGYASTVLGHNSQLLTITPRPAGIAAYKQVSLYGRDHEQVGVSTNYVSCGGLRMPWKSASSKTEYADRSACAKWTRRCGAASARSAALLRTPGSGNAHRMAVAHQVDAAHLGGEVGMRRREVGDDAPGPGSPVVAEQAAALLGERCLAACAEREVGGEHGRARRTAACSGAWRRRSRGRRCRRRRCPTTAPRRGDRRGRRRAAGWRPATAHGGRRASPRAALPAAPRAGARR